MNKQSLINFKYLITIMLSRFIQSKEAEDAIEKNVGFDIMMEEFAKFIKNNSTEKAL